jgi:cell division protein FtsI (penicillin-binding protein 3)
VFSKQILNPSICSDQTLAKVQEMMFNVVDKKWGTAHKIKDPYLKIAGKTGTCQVDYVTDRVQYISSFVGYFPADKPKYSCIVVIHKPNKMKGYYGATVAAPVFKSIAKKIYNNIPQEVELKSSDLQNLIRNPQAESVIKIPNLKGLTLDQVKDKMKDLPLELVIKGAGKVIDQFPQAEKELAHNQILTLMMS